MVRPGNVPPSTSVAPRKSADKAAAAPAKALSKKAAEGVVGTEPIAAAKPRRKVSKNMSVGKRLVAHYRRDRVTESAIATSHVSPLTDAFLWRIIKCWRRDNDVEFKVGKAAFAFLGDVAHAAADSVLERTAGVVAIAKNHIVTPLHVHQARQIQGFKRQVVLLPQMPHEQTERSRRAFIAHKKQKAQASVERKARKEAKAAAIAAAN
jgi:hypothetical protein